MSKPKRNAREIQAELVRRGLSQVALAGSLGLSQSLVSRTIRGAIHNRRVLRELVRLGIPARFLALPDDMQPMKEKEAA